MSGPSRSTTAHWLATMAAWKRWFGYTVEGLEHLRTHECKIVVGYHGRPLAWDLFLLGAEIHREQGYLPLALVHRDFMKWPYLRWLTEGLVWSTGQGPVLDDAIAKGRHVILAPGGEREGLRPGWVRYQVDWQGLGYLKLAISRGLEVVPVAASGVDATYFGLNDGAQLKQRLRIEKTSATPWFGLGPLGLYPLSPPLPARMHQIVGAPIVPVYSEAERKALLADPEALQQLHERVTARVQALLDLARVRTLPRALDRAAAEDSLFDLRLEPRLDSWETQTPPLAGR
jgi:1-acyl-sn-glycerol-3-phosphate acyltransferase